MTSTPSPRPALEQTSLQAAAGPDWVVELHDAAESTNAIAAADPRRGLVVVTDHQTAGRGRLDRGWTTPRGAALTFSAVVDPVVDVQHWSLLPLVAGLAVSRAIGEVSDGVLLKWPNDVLIRDRKVCGILMERVQPARGPALAVIGIGINVDQTRDELPVEHATSLALSGLPQDRTELLGRVLSQLRSGLARLTQGPSDVVADYRGRSRTLDQDVRVSLPDGSSVEGRVVDFDPAGQLVLLPHGERALVVGAGDVVHVRPVSVT